VNKDRRKRLAEIEGKLEELKDQLEAIRAEEEEAFDNLPESIQDGEKGQNIDANREALEQAVDSLDESLNAIRQADN